MKPFEIDDMHLSEVWLQVEGFERRERREWERTRLRCYYTAIFGNSDPKKIANTLTAFMPFPWETPKKSLRERNKEWREQEKKRLEERAAQLKIK